MAKFTVSFVYEFDLLMTSFANSAIGLFVSQGPLCSLGLVVPAICTVCVFLFYLMFTMANK